LKCLLAMSDWALALGDAAKPLASAIRLNVINPNLN
jgi:hypothetical protein